MIDNKKIPKEVLDVVSTLERANFDAYLVGGCTRDLLLGKTPKDWDITTNANPEEIQSLFDKSFYENDYGTVTVVNEETEEQSLKNIEITPFRLEAKYSNSRHPDSVSFSKNIEDDLKRRDFTINAIAYNPTKGQLVDPYKGQVDLSNKLIRAVGDPDERFSEDALRMMRAVRLSTELELDISRETHDSIEKMAKNIDKIASERIRDEFSRVTLSSNPLKGVELMGELGLLKSFAPELEKGIGVEQNGDHIYDVWTHNLKAMQNAADKDWPLHVRLGALFHDISKPETRRWSEEKQDWTFYGHEVVGSRVANQIMGRLKYPNKMKDVVSKLVRWHMFFSDVDQITLSAVRRLIVNVGVDNVEDLMKIRVCDRVGMGRPKEKPYRLRKYEAMVEEALREPISVKKLKLNGDIMLADMHFKPGPRIGWILHALLEEVLDDPEKNTLTYLKKRAKALDKLDDKELKAFGDSGKSKKDTEELKEIEKINKKHKVK